MKPVRFSGEVVRLASIDLMRRPLGTALSIASMTVAMTLMSAFVIGMQGASQAVQRWGGQSVAEVYLVNGASQDRVATLASALRAVDDVREVEFVDAVRALDEFREQFPEFSDVEGLLGGNPLPASLRLTLASPADADLDALQAVVWSHGGGIVDGFRYDREWLASLGQIGQAVAWFLLTGSAVLLLAALVTVGSVVRLALDDKRDEVRLMRLIGAPVSFVVAPILVSGALVGLVGGTFAVGIADLVRGQALTRARGGPFEGWADLLLGSGLDIGAQAVLVLFALAAGAAAAGLAAGREAVR